MYLSPPRVFQSSSPDWSLCRPFLVPGCYVWQKCRGVVMDSDYVLLLHSRFSGPLVLPEFCTVFRANTKRPISCSVSSVLTTAVLWFISLYYSNINELLLFSTAFVKHSSSNNLLVIFKPPALHPPFSTGHFALYLSEMKKRFLYGNYLLEDI